MTPGCQVELWDTVGTQTGTPVYQLGSKTQHEYKTTCPGHHLVALRHNRNANRHATWCCWDSTGISEPMPPLGGAGTWLMWKQMNTCCHLVLVHGRQMFLRWLMVMLRHSRLVNSMLVTVLGHGRYATDMSRSPHCDVRTKPACKQTTYIPLCGNGGKQIV